jgi:hypothetical protein
MVCIAAVFPDRSTCAGPHEATEPLEHANLSQETHLIVQELFSDELEFEGFAGGVRISPTFLASRTNERTADSFRVCTISRAGSNVNDCELNELRMCIGQILSQSSLGFRVDEMPSEILEAAPPDISTRSG